MPHTELTLSWDRLHRDALTLSATLAAIAPAGGWRGIIAVSRGGLVPAAIVARACDIRLVDTVAISSYDGKTRGIPRLLKPPAAAPDGGAGMIIIDDLADSGQTFRLLRDLLPLAHRACLYAKPAGRAAADSYAADMPQDVWIVFPWDVDLA